MGLYVFLQKKNSGFRTMKLVFGQVLFHRNKPEHGVFYKCACIFIFRLLNLSLFCPFLNIQDIVHQLG